MSGEEHIGIDVHQATISVAVMESRGTIVLESILRTEPLHCWSSWLDYAAACAGS